MIEQAVEGASWLLVGVMTGYTLVRVALHQNRPLRDHRHKGDNR